MSAVDTNTVNTKARAVADVSAGEVHASVAIAASPERVFQALASEEIVKWWVRPGVFDTKEWSGEVRVAGRWRSSGLANGHAYALEGEFLEVDPPRKLVHTWHLEGAPGTPTIVTYLLEPMAGGTRLTLRHTGFPPTDTFGGTTAGWEASFDRLAELLAD